MRNELRPRWFVRGALVAVLLGWNAGAVWAAPTDGVVGTGTPASCTGNALQAAINSSPTVTFNCGSTPATIVTDTYVISGNTAIDGANLVTLNGESLRQHFLVQAGGTLTLRNIVLSNGNSNQGGSINNSGTVNIEHVRFQSNSASDSGGAIWSTGTLRINDGTFLANKAPKNTIGVGHGGAIGSLGALTMTKGYFSVNEGRFGGAVFVGGTLGNASATIDRTTFYGNTAGQLGGGLYTNVETTAITVDHSVFDHNTAVTGGGIGRFAAKLQLNNSSLTYNTATNGGGLWVGAGPTPASGGYVQVRSATFSSNTATSNRGGGVFNEGQVELYHTTIVSNTNGVWSSSGNTRFRNTVLQNGSSLNCDGNGTATISDDAANFSTDNSCQLQAQSQFGLGLDPKLGPLQFDPDGTGYHMPLAGSPLIDTGYTGCPALDQRGASRVGACDRGAVEAGGLLPRIFMPLAQSR